MAVVALRPVKRCADSNGRKKHDEANKQDEASNLHAFQM
jgi:hypothetical protein